MHANVQDPVVSQIVGDIQLSGAVDWNTERDWVWAKSSALKCAGSDWCASATPHFASTVYPAIARPACAAPQPEGRHQ